MRKARQVVVVAVGALLAATVLFPSSRSPSVVGAFIDPLLAEILQQAAPDAELEALAVLPSIPTRLDLTLLASTGVSVGGFRHLPMAAVSGTRAEIELLSGLPLVRGMWMNRPVEEALDQSTEQLQASAVWEEPRPDGEPLGYTGRGVGVATIDSGIDGLHPGVPYPAVTVQNVRTVGFKDLVWWPALEDVAVTDVTSGHGTHVAGIIAGRGTAGGHYVGVAPGAHLVGVNAGDGLEMLTILQSYDWIFANKDEYGIRVINNSWAHSEPQVPYVFGDPLDQASRTAVQDHGLVVVFAAGNSGQTGDVFNNYARNDWVISVGGVTKLGTLAGFSSRGNETYHANVMAPGDFIASARATLGPMSVTSSTPFDLTDPMAPRIIPVDQWPYYTVKSGTSMAAPHVSGVVALILEANPSLAPAQVRQILIDTARPVPGCATIDCGAGEVNALAAVRAALGLATNRAPTASATFAPAVGASPLDVVFDASPSFDPDGTIARYEWDWDGDTVVDLTATGPVAAHAFAAGTHHPSLGVVDDRGLASAPAVFEIRSSEPPTASATAPTKAKGGEAVIFDATSSTDDGQIVSYEWYFGDSAQTVVTTTAVVQHSFAVARPTVYSWAVRVTDDVGLVDGAGASIRITP